MPIRTAGAVWEGTLREGKGTVRLMQDRIVEPYSFASRFAAGPGTNPEELIAAAHAGCFSMAFAGALEQQGFRPERVTTSAHVHIDKVGEGFTITAIDLDTKARVAGITPPEFERIAEDAKRNCPVSRALAGTTIRLVAKLE